MSTEYKFLQENAYFAASNSRRGFYSYYEHCFRHRVDRLYCIKGGPGTGKSTLMRKAAKRGEERGFRVEYYYCSSDPNSLDAVLMFGSRGSIGFLDATPPHPMEPMLPGVEEEIIDLGRFWDSSALGKHHDEIIRLNEQKGAAYRDAYRWLKGAGEASDVLRDGMEKCLNEPKMLRAAKRLMQNSVGEKREEGRIRIALSDSIGMAGRVRLDSYLRAAERICLIENFHDCAYVLMDEIARLATEYRQNVHFSYHPVLPDRIDTIRLEGSGTVFCVCDAEQTDLLKSRFPNSRVLDMRRMVLPDTLREYRGQLRRTNKIREALLERACDSLKQVGDAHFKLEEIYISAMDFKAKAAYTEEILDKIFS